MTTTYANPYPVSFPWELHSPVPGWGFTPNLAGPRMIAVGAVDEPVVGWPIALGVGAVVGYSAYALLHPSLRRRAIEHHQPVAEETTTSMAVAGALALGIALAMRYGLHRGA
jgi:tetrahydromethanopterin S-methyltransferase subunit C